MFFWVEEQNLRTNNFKKIEMENIIDLLKTLHPTLTSHKLLQNFIIYHELCPTAK
jgi:hypothetical protein